MTAETVTASCPRCGAAVTLTVTTTVYPAADHGSTESRYYVSAEPCEECHRATTAWSEYERLAPWTDEEIAQMDREADR